MTTHEAIIGQIDYVNGDPQTWGTQLTYEDETTTPKYRATTPRYSINLVQGDRPAESHLVDAYDEEADSTVISMGVSDSPFAGGVFCRNLWRNEPEGYVKVALNPLARPSSKWYAASFPPVDLWYWMLEDLADVSIETGRTSSAHYPYAGEERSTLTWSPARPFVNLLHNKPIRVHKGLGYSDLIGPSFGVAIRSFAEGIAGVRPSSEVVATAVQILEAGTKNSIETEIEVDESDGVLTFEFRLKRRSLLVVGELSLDGDLRANIYNDRHPDVDAGIEEIWVEHLPQTSAEELITLF